MSQNRRGQSNPRLNLPGKPQELELVIEKIVPGGQGLARGPDGVVFVAGALPGEHVRVKITKSKKGYQEAQLLEVIQASPRRVKAVCQHYGTCGGCDLMHASYELQIEIKKSIFLDAMHRQGPWNRQEKSAEHLQFLAGKPLQYRSRFRFSIDQDGFLGLLGRNSNHIVRLNDCSIAHPRIRERIQQNQPVDLVSLKTPLGNFDQNGQEDSLDIRQEGDYPVFADDKQLFLAGQAWHTMVHGKIFSFDSNSFFQSNIAMLSSMADWVKLRLAHFVPDTSRVLLDLYGGVGTFCVLLSQPGNASIVVDSNQHNIEHARLNTKAIGAQVFTGTVDEWLTSSESDAFTKHEGALLMVLDPPRSGLSKALLESIQLIKPRAIVYVSCNPTSFARDSLALEKQGYVLADLCLFDFYPQTWHIESAAIFLINDGLASDS